MTPVDRGVVANFLANAWLALVAIIFAPIYIKYIGIEGYGLIGAFSALQALVGIWGLSVGRVLTNEIVKFRAGRISAQQVCDLHRTFMLGYSTTALLVSILIAASAPWVSRHWLQLSALREDEVTEALRLVGALIGIRWVSSVYRSVLSASSDIVWANLNGALFSTLQGVGAAVAAAYISSSVRTYFTLQIVLAVCELIRMRVRANRVLPRAPQRARASLAALQPVWRFSAGVTALTAVAMLNTQVDRLMLPRLVSLQEFGHYALAAAIASAVRMFFYPMSQAHAQFGLRIEQAQYVELFAAFHRTAQVLALMLIPASFVLCVFANDVLVLWGLEAQLAHQVAPLVRWLVIGTMFSGLMLLPHALQLAHGRTRKLVGIHLTILACYVPLVWFGVRLFGTIGAAAAWAAINAGYVLLGAPQLFKHYPRELRIWLTRDVFKPLLVVAVIVLPIAACADRFQLNSPLISAIVIAVAGMAAIVGVLSATAFGRQAVTDLRLSLSRVAGSRQLFP